MKKIKLTTIFLALCLMLSACVTLPDGNNTIAQNDPPVHNTQNDQTPDKDTETPPDQNTTPDDDNNNQNEPVCPADMTVELVVDWAMADTILSILDDLSDLLREAVEEAGCQLDHVTLTINTAGAYTADSLVDGGIDAAILPSVDIIPYENRVAILALSNDEIPQTAIAVSLANSDLSEEFRSILFSALTQTQAGQDFLAAFCGEAVFVAPTEETLQSVRDYLHELEEGEYE